MHVAFRWGDKYAHDPPKAYIYKVDFLILLVDTLSPTSIDSSH
jgi:hypothetical protein